MATPTAPEKLEGGATIVSACGVTALMPTNVAAASCCYARSRRPLSARARAPGPAGGWPPAGSLRAANGRLEARSRSAVLELYSLDARLGNAQSRLSLLGRQAETLRGGRASLTAQLAA